MSNISSNTDNHSPTAFSPSSSSSTTSSISPSPTTSTHKFAHTTTASNTNNSSTPASVPATEAQVEMNRQRRPSVTTTTPLSTLFQRSNSISTGTPIMPGPITTAALQDRRRRMSTMGLTGTSPVTSQASFALRRGSISTTASESIDENAIDEDEASPTTPFGRRMSMNAQAMRALRHADPAYNWSEQLRYRAESNLAAGNRSSFSFGSVIGRHSPPPPPSVAHPTPSTPLPAHRTRAATFSEMPTPPAQNPQPRKPQKPDAFQERILKGDFYMD